MKLKEAAAGVAGGLGKVVKTAPGAIGRTALDDGTARIIGHMRDAGERREEAENGSPIESAALYGADLTRRSVEAFLKTKREQAELPEESGDGDSETPPPTNPATDPSAGGSPPEGDAPSVGDTPSAGDTPPAETVTPQATEPTMEPAPEPSPDSPVNVPAEPAPEVQPELSAEPLNVGTPEPVRELTEPMPTDAPPPTEPTAAPTAGESGTVHAEPPAQSPAPEIVGGREPVSGRESATESHPPRHSTGEAWTEQCQTAPTNHQSGTSAGPGRGRTADATARDTGTRPRVREKEAPKTERTAPGTRSKVKTKEAAAPGQQSQTVSLGRQKAVREKAQSAAARSAETNTAETVSGNAFETVSREPDSILPERAVSRENFTDNRPAYPSEDVRDHPAGTGDAYRQPESGTYSRQMENATPVQRSDTTAHSRQPENGTHSRQPETDLPSRQPVKERPAVQPGAGPDAPREGRVAVKTRDAAGRDAVPVPAGNAPQAAVKGREKAVRERTDCIAEKAGRATAEQEKHFTVNAESSPHRTATGEAHSVTIRTRESGGSVRSADRGGMTDTVRNAEDKPISARAEAVPDAQRQPEMPRDRGSAVKTKEASGGAVKTREINEEAVPVKESRPGAEPFTPQDTASRTAPRQREPGVRIKDSCVNVETVSVPDTTPRTAPRRRQPEIKRRETQFAVEPVSSQNTVSHTLPPENSTFRTLPRHREPNIKVRDTRTITGTITDTPTDYGTTTPAVRAGTDRDGAVRTGQPDIKTRDSQTVKPHAETAKRFQQTADRCPASGPQPRERDASPIDHRGRGQSADQSPAPPGHQTEAQSRPAVRPSATAEAGQTKAGQTGSTSPSARARPTGNASSPARPTAAAHSESRTQAPAASGTLAAGHPDPTTAQAGTPVGEAVKTKTAYLRQAGYDEAAQTLQEREKIGRAGTQGRKLDSPRVRQTEDDHRLPRTPGGEAEPTAAPRPQIPESGRIREKASDRTVRELVRDKRTIKTARPGIKEAGKTGGKAVKTAEQTAEKSLKTADKAARRAAQTAQAAKRASRQATVNSARAVRAAANAAKAGTRTIVEAARAIVAAAKAAMASLQALIAGISAGGWVVILVVLVILIAAMLLATPFGIFFSNETDAAQNIQTAISQLNGEFTARIGEIQSEIAHDELDMPSDIITTMSANWKDVLAVYAVRANTDEEDSSDVVTLTDEKKEILREVFWDMNPLNYWTTRRTEGSGEDAVTIITLHIRLNTKNAGEMSEEYDFNRKQNERGAAAGGGNSLPAYRAGPLLLGRQKPGPGVGRPLGYAHAGVGGCHDGIGFRWWPRVRPRGCGRLAVPARGPSVPTAWTVPASWTGFSTTSAEEPTSSVMAAEPPRSTATVPRFPGPKHSRETWCSTQETAMWELLRVLTRRGIS